MSTHELEMKVEEATQEAEAIKDAIKLHMGDAEELRAGEYKVRWTRCTTTRVDTTALKAAAPELVARFTKTTVTRRFTVA